MKPPLHSGWGFKRRTALAIRKSTASPSSMFGLFKNQLLGSGNQVLKFFDGSLWVRAELVNNFVTVITSSYTATADDKIIVCNSSSALTVYLPSATTKQAYFIKNIGTGAVTVDGAGSETIDGSTTQILYQWEGMHVLAYTTGAWIID